MTEYLITRIQESAHITWPLTLTLSTPWMHAYPETIVCKFGDNPAISLREEAIFVPAQKCPYHVTFDLDLEHNLDARWPGQARRETQRGPGKHYSGALSPPPPHSVCREIDRSKAPRVERKETWGEVSPHRPTRGSGERRKLHRQGTGRSPGWKWIFLHILGQKEATWNTIFSIFERRRGPQNVAGPGKIFPPFPPLDGPGPGVHRVQVWWQSGHLSARSDLRKSLQTDRRTDDGRPAIALAHSWNELKTILHH